MSKQYRVIGTRAVAGVAPGGLVDHDTLVKRKANIGLLLGSHLEEVADAKPKTATQPKDDKAGG